MPRTLVEFKIDKIRDELKHQKDCIRTGLKTEAEVAEEGLVKVHEMIDELQEFILDNLEENEK